MKTKFRMILMAFATLVLLGSATCSREVDEPVPVDNSSENNNGDYVGSFYRESFIDYYVRPDSLKAALRLAGGELFVKLGFFGKEYSYYGGSAEFKRLSRKYGDTYFNRKAPWGISALSEAILSVEVVALTDYDAEHPQGSSLNDIIVFYHSETKLEYIQHGYDGHYLHNATYPLSAFPTGGIALADDVLSSLDFTRMPSGKGEYSMQVTLTMESGRKLSKVMSITI